MVGPNEFQYDQLYRSMLREAVFTITHKIRAQDPDANQIVFAFPSRSVVLSPGDPQIEGYRQRGITPYYDPNRNVYKIEFNVGQSFLSIQDEAQIQFIKKMIIYPADMTIQDVEFDKADGSTLLGFYMADILNS